MPSGYSGYSGYSGATQAIIGKGTTLAYCLTQAGSYTTVAEVTNSDMPKISVDKADATNYLSPNGTKESVPGWKVPGEVSFEFNYTNTNCTAMYGQLGIQQWWQINLPDTHTWTFAGWLADFEGTIPNDKVLTVKGKIAIATAPIYA